MGTGEATRPRTGAVGGDAAAQGAPALVSLNPFHGTGLSANLTLVYSDPNGWAAIKSAEFILNPRWEAGLRGGGLLRQIRPGRRPVHPHRR